jgi:hypothetical protein
VAVAVALVELLVEMVKVALVAQVEFSMRPDKLYLLRKL